MNIYVETNFVLELSLLQENHESCQGILSLCEQGRAQLIIPAYSLAEPHETLTRRDRSRKQLARELQAEYKQLSRSTANTTSDTFQAMLSLLTMSGEVQKQRLAAIQDRLLYVAEIIPLDSDILLSAAANDEQLDLSPQDALVFASVLHHLRPRRVASCFLTQNSKDFKAVDIQQMLADYDCRLLFSFKDGYDFIKSQI